MKRLWLAVMLVFTLGFGTITAMAQEPAEHPGRIADNAKILTYTEQNNLEKKADEIAGQYGMDVAVVTVKKLGIKNVQKEAENIFNEEGYGAGEGKDGILLLVDIEGRDWAITTHGSAIDLFTDYRLKEIGDRMLIHLGDDQYFDAFDTYLHDVEVYLEDRDGQSGEAAEGAAAGEENGISDGAISGAIDSAIEAGKEKQEEAAKEEAMKSEEPEKEVNPLKNMIMMSLVGGIVVTAVYVIRQTSKMKNVKKQEKADGYMKKESYELTKEQDIFLYSRTEDKIKDPRRSDPGLGRPHDRTTTHVNRDGERHGGRSGKF